MWIYEYEYILKIFIDLEKSSEFLGGKNQIF